MALAILYQSPDAELFSLMASLRPSQDGGQVRVRALVPRASVLDWEKTWEAEETRIDSSTTIFYGEEDLQAYLFEKGFERVRTNPG